MQKEQVKTFIELVEGDQRIIQLTKELEEGAGKKAQLSVELAAIDQEVEAADKVVHDIQKNVDSLELDIKTLHGKQVRTEEKLLTAGSPKELEALEHEKEDLDKKQRELDEQGLVALEELENAQKHAALLRADKPEKLAQKQKEIDELDKRLDHVKKLHDAYTKQRKELEPQVPEELIDRYDTMKVKVPNPVVPVIKGGCSGCFYGLSNPELVKVQQGMLVTCQSCYRTLYVTKVEQNEERQSDD